MEESDSEKKTEKENVGPKVEPPLGEPEGSLGWAMPNAAMKKKVRCVRYFSNMKEKVRSCSSGNLAFSGLWRESTWSLRHSSLYLLTDLLCLKFISWSQAMYKYYTALCVCTDSFTQIKRYMHFFLAGIGCSLLCTFIGT